VILAKLTAQGGVSVWDERGESRTTYSMTLHAKLKLSERHKRHAAHSGHARDFTIVIHNPRNVNRGDRALPQLKTQRDQYDMPAMLKFRVRRSEHTSFVTTDRDTITFPRLCMTM